MVKDFWNKTIENGDFVVSASKSEGGMVMGVMKDVSAQTRVRIDWDHRMKKWMPHNKPTRMYTMERTLKLPDDMIVQHNPDLFDVMNDVRQALKLPTKRGLKAKLANQTQLQKILESVLQ